jgi:hypothetical protein
VEDFKRYTGSEIHWKLFDVEPDQRANDPDDDGWCPVQALHCPYYVPLEGHLGSDWGVIVNPQSTKFGRVVFEHEWCGCPTQMTDVGWQALHPEGQQRVDEWLVASCRASHKFRDGKWVSCDRPTGHKGLHESHSLGRRWR